MRLFAQQRRVITVPLVAFVLVIVCGCSVTLLAVGYGTGTPPQFALDLGLMQVIGRLSTVPECSYATSCLLDPSGRDPSIYTVWLILRSSRSDTPFRVIRLTSVPVGDVRKLFLDNRSGKL